VRTGSSLARKAVKAAVLPGGIVTRRRPGDVVILLYHRVGGPGGEIDLPAALFERQLATLAEHDRVLTIDQAVAGDPAGGVVVTVDDGYRDFHEVVLPLLVRFRVPAVLYLATGLVAGEGAGPDDPDAITWSQLAEAVATGLVTVGSHTHNHVDLAHATRHTCRDELCRSRELIEDRLGVACRHFAYPWAVGSPSSDRLVR
jgi:peptidoglycan/xylan/chitin deacetylase (PgdA/CDA1 family)